MGVPRALGYAATLAAFTSVAPAAGQDIDCHTVGNDTHCTTKQPLDYAKTLQAGRALVPPIEPAAPTPGPQAAIPHLTFTPPTPPRPTSIWTGNYLLDLCESDTRSCLGFIRGTFSGFSGGLEVAKVPQRICLPEGVTMGQTRDVVIKWLKDNPQERQGEASAIVVVSLIHAFPCQ